MARDDSSDSACRLADDIGYSQKGDGPRTSYTARICSSHAHTSSRRGYMHGSRASWPLPARYGLGELLL